MQRHQFSVMPVFTITVHKDQGQTFDVVVVSVDIGVFVFMHGILYVAFARVNRSLDKSSVTKRKCAKN